MSKLIPPITDQHREVIEPYIKKVAKAANVTVLFAAESGSRSWGFNSHDSDFDVRCIGIANDPKRYLSLYQKPYDQDVKHSCTIDGMDIDFVMWDLGKALRLLWKSNPSLIEWMQSPVLYRAMCGDVQAMIENSRHQWYSPFSHAMHYESMARKNTREFLQGDDVSLKKYLYIVRPLLCALALLEADRPALFLPAINFEDLLAEAEIADDVRQETQQLLTRKRQGEELSRGPHIRVLDDFIQHQLTTLVGRIQKRIPYAPFVHAEREADRQFYEYLHVSNLIAPMSRL